MAPAGTGGWKSTWVDCGAQTLASFALTTPLQTPHSGKVTGRLAWQKRGAPGPPCASWVSRLIGCPHGAVRSTETVFTPGATFTLAGFTVAPGKVKNPGTSVLL